MEELLSLFETLTGHLDKLTELAKQKTLVVRKSDLLELDRILREEQALSLALRGAEQKRTALLQKLGLTDVPLTELPAKAPEALQQKARDTVDALRRSFQIYTSAAETARNTLECNLHEVERFLAAAGAESVGAPGYGNNDVDPPSQMKADFRA